MAAGAVTVTAHTAVIAPEVSEAVIVALPGPTAVTCPPLTAATALAEVDQTTAPPAGVGVAISV